MKRILRFAAGLAVAVFLTIGPNAAGVVIYDWVQGTTGAVNGTATSSGQIMYDAATGTIESYSFDLTTPTLSIQDNALDAWSTIIIGGVQPPMNAYVGTTTVLPDGNLQFLSVSSGSYPANMSSVSSSPSYSTTGNSTWTATAGATSGANENSFLPTNGRSALTGDWVPVPEPATISLLLLAFGASTLRILRGRQMA
jgi:hypothetical protein